MLTLTHNDVMLNLIALLYMTSQSISESKTWLQNPS